MPPGIRALRMLGRLPFSARRFAGARLGDAARLVGIRRRVAARNLELAFPNLSAAERKDILRRHFQFLGTVFLDECALLAMPEENMRRWIAVENEESLSEKKPVILCVPHFAAATVAGVRLSSFLGGRMVFHYKPMHSGFWDGFYTRLRQQYGATGAAATKKNVLLSCARHVRGGGVFYYLPDADPKRRKNAAFVPFLGVEAATTTAVSRLASSCGAEVRVFTALQTKEGYRARLSPPLKDFPGEDAVADARRINDLIGEQVRREPAQYYWLHRRFKTRPEGEGNIYA